MARKRGAERPNVLDELESQGDALAEWLQRNARPVIAVVAGSLVLAAGYGGYRSWSGGRETAAAEALGEVETAYFAELGASSDSIALPELANPDAGRAVRDEYVERFRSVAAEHEGTTAAALARLQQAELLALQGDDEQAEAVLRQAADALGGGSRLRPLLLEHLGQLHERSGRWAEAAEAYAEAGGNASYELRHWALADAARCYAQAGENGRARELFDRIQAEAPDLTLPSHLRDLARELQAATPG